MPSLFCALADAGTTWASSALLQHIFTIFGGDEYMFGKKVFAAMLATILGASLFGANVAKAVIDLDDDEGEVIYATETLVEATVTDLTGYSVVMGPGDILNVRAAIGLGGPTGTYVTVKFVLSGMVFSTAVAGGDLTIVGGSYGTPASRRSGGQVGEADVSFIVTRSANDASDSDVVTLSIDQLGVKPGVPGSVMMTVTDSVGDAEEHTASYANAVRTMRALDEKPVATNLVATVETRFKSFRPVPGTATATMGTLGSFMVDAKTAYLAAGDGLPVVLAEDIIMTGDTSSVTISGDFSFADMAWLDTAMTCDTEATPADLLDRDDETVMDDLMEQTPLAFTTAAQYLCISVLTGDEAVAIPAAGPYIVTTAYDAATEGAGWPPSAGEHALGSITRDGTTVHIPYLTTFGDYNQRIVVSNRGANPAPYWITFRPEDGTTATPGMYAMGTLEANSTMVLRAEHVVTLVGRSRTAATFVAEAKATQVDVATVIVNMMTGGTDTVNYEPEPTD